MLGIGKQNGVDVINKSIGVFQKCAEELENGIAMCDDEIAGVDEQIKALAEQKASLANSKVKAQRVRMNIMEILK